MHSVVLSVAGVLLLLPPSLGTQRRLMMDMTLTLSHNAMWRNKSALLLELLQSLVTDREHLATKSKYILTPVL